MWVGARATAQYDNIEGKRNVMTDGNHTHTAPLISMLPVIWKKAYEVTATPDL